MPPHTIIPPIKTLKERGFNHTSSASVSGLSPDFWPKLSLVGIVSRSVGIMGGLERMQQVDDLCDKSRKQHSSNCRHWRGKGSDGQRQHSSSSRPSLDRLHLRAGFNSHAEPHRPSLSSIPPPAPAARSSSVELIPARGCFCFTSPTTLSFSPSARPLRLQH